MTALQDACLIELIESARGHTSPFDRMIVLAWFDGPTQGVVVCQEHNVAYRFRALAIDHGKYDFDAWDHGRDIQIVGLTMLEPDLFADIVAILSEDESPSWPIWFRGPYKDPAIFKANHYADDAANSLLAQVPKLDAVVAVPTGGLLENVLAARKIVAEVALPVEFDDWFSLLGYFADNK